MNRRRPARLFGTLAACAMVLGASRLVAGRAQQPWGGVLDEHPTIQYATRPTRDRVAQLSEALRAGTRTLARDSESGYLRSVLEALSVPIESQLLVFSKTGVQRAYTSPENPRALFFNESLVVGYIHGAPALELAAHDPEQGVVFYTLDQAATEPRFVRRTTCLTCHVSASTMYVPGMIVRSHIVGENGATLSQAGTRNVDHRTPHPDRWGGWYVTSEATATPYGQRAHGGNITFSAAGFTANQVFVDWMNSAPERRGYPSGSSDIVSLLVFDHQMHAINLLTRLNWEARVAAAMGTNVGEQLIDEVADYLLFADEAPPSAPLTPRPEFARYLASLAPTDPHGRSLGQLDLVRRLLRYPCSYMVYSAAFDALQPATKQAVYRRMIHVLSDRTGAAGFSADDRRAILEILRDTKDDFPR